MNCKAMRLCSKCWVLMLIIFFAGTCGQAFGKSIDCWALFQQLEGAQSKGQWERTVTLGQEFTAKCQSIKDVDVQDVVMGLTAEGMYELGRYQEILSVLQPCVSRRATYTFMCWYLLGKTSVELGNSENAKYYLNRCIESYPSDAASVELIQEARRIIAGMEPPRVPAPPPVTAPPASPAPVDPANPRKEASGQQHSYGTGFFVSASGHIITNNHVVAACRTLTTGDGKPLVLIDRDPRRDLALLKASFAPPKIAFFRIGSPPKVGDSVIVFGFPLPGLLSSQGIVTTGILSAASGVGDDVRFVQISAPVQPGNSGGPLLDTSGNVIGVVVAKLDALEVLRVTGDIPQNVNFAVHWASVRSFIDEQGIAYSRRVSQHINKTADVAALASQISVAIDCTN